MEKIICDQQLAQRYREAHRLLIQQKVGPYLVLKWSCQQEFEQPK